MTKVVIVGASFAGFRAYGYLKKNGPEDLEITLIDKSPVATYIPSLHLSLGNQKNTHLIQLATQKYYQDFVCGEVTQITPHHVQTTEEKYEYDYLILAMGATTNFFGNESLEKYTYPAKTAADISIINQRLRDVRHITVVGGGLTGVEYAAMLATRTEKHVSLVTSDYRLVPGLPEKASRLTEQFLKRHNVELRFHAKATEATENSLKLSDGRFINTDLIIWCAGIDRNNPLITEELKTQTNVFIAGDLRVSNQTPTAHNAMICGEAIAKSIIGKLKGENIPLDLHNWETLALALGSSYGLFIYKNKRVFRNPFTGIMKWFIERRVLKEWRTKKLSWFGH